MLRHLLSALAGVLLPIALAFGGIAILADKASAAPAQESLSQIDPVFPRGLPWAYGEDSCFAKRCVWDARHQGNGKGRSFIMTRFHGEYLVQHISHRRAHRLQAAWCEREQVTCDGYTD